MTKSDIKYIKKLGMIVGSHGHSHQLFSKMEKKNQNIEIYKSKKFLEKITKSDVNMFCYPYGRKYSYNLNTLYLIKKNKFNFAFSVTSKNANINKMSTRFQLPRYDTNEFLKNEKNTTITR
jgi:peptidoglycan/xylan/chitin deacetylase (PgdA/CDA1 family)